MNGSFVCPNGGPHYFSGGDRCVCGAEEGYVLQKRSEHERLTSDLAAANATIEAERAAHRATEQERIDEAVNATVAEHDLQEARATIEAQALVLATLREACLDEGDYPKLCLLCQLYFQPDSPELTHDPDCILATPQPAAVEQAAAVLKALANLDCVDSRRVALMESPASQAGQIDGAECELLLAAGYVLDAYRRARLALSLAGSGEG